MYKNFLVFLVFLIFYSCENSKKHPTNGIREVKKKYSKYWVNTKCLECLKGDKLPRYCIKDRGYLFVLDLSNDSLKGVTFHRGLEVEPWHEDMKIKNGKYYLENKELKFEGSNLLYDNQVYVSDFKWDKYSHLDFFSRLCGAFFYDNHKENLMFNTLYYKDSISLYYNPYENVHMLKNTQENNFILEIVKDTMNLFEINQSNHTHTGFRLKQKRRYQIPIGHKTER